jgi:hypothetical protein
VLDGSEQGPGAGGSGAGGAGAGGSVSTASGPGNTGISCDYNIAGTHVCALYQNIPAADMQALESACMSEMGTFGTACPTDGALGTCSQSAGGITEGVVYYDSGGITADEAQMACSGGGGMWTPA